MAQPAVLKGLQISRDIPYRDPDALFALVGADGTGKSAYLPIGQAMLERHLLLLGSGASGKTNMLLHLARNLRANLSQQDVLVVFDPAGEYYRALYQQGDAVLSDDSRTCTPNGRAGWNLFLELNDPDNLVEDAAALCGQLFARQIAEAPDPFYPAAARDLTMALIVYLSRQGGPKLCTNQALRELIDGFDTDSMLEILRSEPELRTFCGYLSEGADSLRTQGVVSALQQTARELFQNCFGLQGDLGVRSFLQARGGTVLFICYDPAHGQQTRPIFGTLCDLVLQQALSCTGQEGRLQVLLDDFCLLPALPHLEDALLLGRNKGLSITLAANGVSAITARYGASAPPLMGALGTTAAFRLQDRASRDYVKNLYGRHRVVETYRSAVQTRGIVEQAVDEYIVGDEDLTTLQPGESIISTMHYPPFRFRLKLYGTKQ